MMIDLFGKHGAAPLGESLSQKAKAKKPEIVVQPRINERKIKKQYILTILKDGVYEPMNDQEYEQFKQDNPDIAKYFDSADPDVVDEMTIPDVPESAPIYDCWDKAAKRLINALWKIPNAFIFHEPVDFVKLNIPDYLDIIRQPMDFGTIKSKLSSNQYLRLQDFLHDVQLVFDNCILYNGENS
jgi:hypothetical protein